MHTDYYRNFIAIVETGSLSKAAAKRRIAQPSLSAQVKKLEEIFGATLLDVRRGVHKLKLTDAGRIFYREALRLVELEDEMQRSIGLADEAAGGILRLSIAPAFSGNFISRYLKPFAAKFPQLRYRVREESHPYLFDSVRQELSEVGISNTPVPQGDDFSVLFSRPERLCALVSADDERFLTRAEISLKELSACPLAVSFGIVGIVEKKAAALGAKPDFFAITASKHASTNIVREKMAAAIIPAAADETAPEGLKFIRLKENLQSEQAVFTLKNHTLTPQMQKFVKFYRTAAN